MQNERQHSVGSVDNALQILLLLSDRQPLRGVDVAAELGEVDGAPAAAGGAA
jgi:hypothetical protein